MYLYFLILLIFGYKNSLICIPHEQRRSPAVRTGHGCGDGRYGKFIRGIVRILGWQVYQLHGRETYHDEPVPHQPGGNERGENGLFEKSRATDMERLAGHGHKDGGPSDRTGHHRVLRHLFQRIRRLHTPAARGFAQEPRYRRPQPQRAAGGKRGATCRTHRAHD